MTPASFPAGGDVSINCTVTFNSTDAGVSPNWCGAAPPNVFFTTQDAGEPVAVLSFATLNMTGGGRLNLVGSRPVVLLVHGAGLTTIDGQIYANGEGVNPGAGGNRTSCGNQRGNNGASGNGRGSGGGGAGFATAGGNGGRGDTSQDDVPGGTGGASRPVGLSPLVGGCPGGRGGGNSGPAGAGGGAVQLSVAGSLVVGAGAVLSVSGGGAQGTTANSQQGANGGGSGGMLLLEAASLDLPSSSTWITANGGAGAQGADNGPPGGAFGPDGRTSSSSVALGGGTGSTTAGGAGGDGAAGMTGPTNGQGDSRGGGGGGGAVGRIYLRGATCARAASVSPTNQPGFGCP